MPRLALAATAFAGFSALGSARADTLVINTHGDSLTFGVEEGPRPPGDSNGGFRYHLDLMLTGSVPSGFTDHQFIGGLTDANFEGGPNPSTGADSHYGVRGIEAFGIGRGLFENPGDGDTIAFATNEPGHNSMAFRVENRGATFGYYPFGNPEQTPDRVLVHLGTNTLLQVSNIYADADDSPEDQAFDIATEASWQLGQYLGVLDDAFDSNAQADDTKLIITRVLPLTRDFWGDWENGVQGERAPDGTSVGELQATFLYNYGDGVTSGLGMDEVFSDLPAEVSERIEFVDMFRININDLDLAYLAALEGVSEAVLLTMINTDADPYVDWAEGIDESDYSSLTGYTGDNLNLIGDGIHPTDLGHAIMANVFYNGLPEPSTGLVLLAAIGLLRPRRRRAA